MPRRWPKPGLTWESATVGGALRWGMAVLTAAGDDCPQLDAEVLLASVLRASRAHLYAALKEGMSAEAQQQYRAAIVRREHHEPVAYITGHSEFYGLDFVVDRRVLIPRPETELLVEQVIEQARRHDAEGRVLIADVGTGSGAIAISVAKSLPQATIYAIDSSSGALQVAAANVERHGVAERVRLLEGTLLEPLPERVHVLAANLPYIPSAEVDTLMPDVRLYEPRAALDGGTDGLGTIRALVDDAGDHLVPGGVILLEIGAPQGEAVATLARRRYPDATVDILPDLAGLDRIARIILSPAQED